jgi:ribonucleoside-diphosphate reductase alpha chain
MNAGKDNGLQYSACFVLPVGDLWTPSRGGEAGRHHPPRRRDGLRVFAAPPKDTEVKSTGGKRAPVSFLASSTAPPKRSRARTRRGANMASSRDHPDILEFIHCKLDGGISNFNISVSITEPFMEALARNGD